MFVEADEKRDELESVLASAIFRKAPNQSRLLRYLCERGIEGRPEQLKEHQIAIEALGRKDSFDERENSIVRVEISRLRKRLRQYYETEGRRNTLRIAIDPGQYFARFIPAETEAREAEAESPLQGDEVVEQGTDPGDAPSWRHIRWPIAAVALIVIAAVALWWTLARTPARTAAPALAQSSSAVLPAPIPSEPPLSIPAGAVRILAGYDRPFHIDRLGRVWHRDEYFSGGQASATPRQFLARSVDPLIYRHCRVGNFSYDVPLKPGPYEVRLYFAPGVRPWTFTDRPEGYAIVLLINGKDQMFYLNFGVDGSNGPTPDIRVFKDVYPASDGILHLGFKSAAQYDYVNAIEIVPGTRGRLLPIRFASRDYSYTDNAGRTWEPDYYARGGTLVERRDPVSGTSDPDLYSGERFGNFDYLVPVAKFSIYAVELGLSETWFGPTMPGGGAAGSRKFSASCNGVPMLKEFDVFSEAGGANRALLRTFHGLKPDNDGKLRLAFSSAADNAMVNFVEIRDESQ